MPWQPAAIVYPDAELVLTGRLRTELAARPELYAASAFVSNSVPNPRRDYMVIIRRDGGPEGELRDQARISLQVWAKTEKDANDLARLVVALTKTFADGSPIVAVVPNSGPMAIPDESGQPLRYIVADFHTRGDAL